MPQQLEPLDQGRALAEAGDLGRARGRAERGPMTEGDVDAVGRQLVAGALRPFDQRDRAFGQRRQADLLQLGGVADAIEVGVQQRQGGQVVALRQRKRRARHFDRVVVGEIADHGPRRRGLARAQVARQRDDVAGRGQQREIGHQLRGRRLVGERHGKCCRPRHSAASRCTA